MDIDRRGFMKIMFAGTALLACGAPAWAMADPPRRRAEQCVLLLGHAGVEDAFEKGARAACANAEYGGLHTVKLKGLLADPGRVVELLKQSRGMRWIVVMDDASGVVFQELARSAGGRLFSQDNHAYTEGVFPPLRNVWLAASPDQSAGGILASSLIERDGDFSIVERFLREPSTDSFQAGWSAPGFFSYRSGDPHAIHLHCSGLSLSDACGLIGMSASAGLTPISWRAVERETVTWQSDAWVESVGYAVAASAFGVSTIRESCSSRAFVHRTGRPGRVLTAQRFTSFVVDL